MRSVGLATALAGMLAATATAHAQPAARLRGVVFDSIGMAPLGDATVRVYRADSAAVGFDARSDASGRFTVPSLPAGTWLLSFLHPRFDALRVEPPVARIDVVETGEIDVTLAVPSGATLARALCGPTRDDSIAVVVGEVREAAARRPVAGALVRANWPEWVFAKQQMRREDVARTARTDSTGQFVLCHVPQGTTVTAFATADADTTGIIELPIPSSAYVVADFVIDQRTQTTPANSAATPWRTGNGIVRGEVVLADGKPLATAIARVLGSGTVVRTDSSGVFRIGDAAAGTQTVEVRAVGYDPVRRVVELRPGDPLAMRVSLTKARVVLDTVRVVAGRRLPPEIEAVERRWRRGVGVILDGATVRERTSTNLTSVMWGVPGVRLGTRNGYGNTIYMRGGGGVECIPPIYLDGFRFLAAGATLSRFTDGISLDEVVPPSEVGAIEIYARPAQRPAEYSDTSDCGVVVVWTTRYLGNVPVLDPRRKKR